MSHLQTNCCLKPYSQEQIIQAEVHVTKHCKDNHLQSMNYAVEYHGWEYKFDVKESKW